MASKSSPWSCAGPPETSTLWYQMKILRCWPACRRKTILKSISLGQYSCLDVSHWNWAHYCNPKMTVIEWHVYENRMFETICLTMTTALLSQTLPCHIHCPPSFRASLQSQGLATGIIANRCTSCNVFNLRCTPRKNMVANTEAQQQCLLQHFSSHSFPKQAL